VRLLFTVVDWVLRLPEALKTRFQDEVHAMSQENDTMEFINCIEEKGIEKGIQKGKLESILQILEARFGAVPDDIAQAVSVLHDLKRLEQLTRTAATVSDLDAFARTLEST